MWFFLFPCFQLSTRLVNWLFCGPCITFLKTSTTFHKMTLTGVTLLVTSLLVASPILFLISAAPSIPQRDGCVAHDDCMVTAPPPECQEPICRDVASSIQAKINWTVDVCKNFKSFSCSNHQNSLKIVKTPQEIADYQMLRKMNFQHFFSFLSSLDPICLYQVEAFGVAISSPFISLIPPLYRSTLLLFSSLY
jgi:hypothetical protein